MLIRGRGCLPAGEARDQHLNTIIINDFVGAVPNTSPRTATQFNSIAHTGMGIANMCRVALHAIPFAI